jgi:hypothetical protein
LCSCCEIRPCSGQYKIQVEQSNVTPVKSVIQPSIVAAMQ